MELRHLPARGERNARLSETPVKGPGGRPPRLSQRQIVDAAERLVERGGPDALTMRRVADELGSSPMSIYRHVRDKDELLVLLLDRLAAAVARPEFSADPRTRTIQACRAIRDGLAEHPWIVDVLAGGELIAPSILWLIEEIVAGFVACGLSPARAADAYRAVWQFTVGELIIRRGLDRVAASGRRPFVIDVLMNVDPDAMPALAALRDHWVPARGRDSYEIGIEALISGLLAD